MILQLIIVVPICFLVITYALNYVELLVAILLCSVKVMKNLPCGHKGEIDCFKSPSLNSCHINSVKKY